MVTQAQPRDEAPAPVAVEPAAAPAPVAAPVEAPAVEPVVTQVAAPAAQAPAPVEPVAAARLPTAAPAPAVAEQPIVIPAATPSAKAQALHDVVNAAGLQWVETDPDRHAQTQLRIAAAHTPARLGRERKAVPPVSNEPLVQVETRH